MAKNPYITAFEREELKKRAAAPQGLPAGVAAVVKACQLDLQPKEARQLDSLVRKRMGVADPRPEATDSADSQVLELADRIVRASVAADIQRIQKGGRS